MGLTPPKYWQLKRIRRMWPDRTCRDIATAVNVSRWTIQQWRDDGLLDPLPERYVVPGQQRTKRNRKPPPTKPNSPRPQQPEPRKLTAAPLTVEPLTECKPCRCCEYERVCRERCRTGVGWMACERPDARALEVARVAVAELT